MLLIPAARVLWHIARGDRPRPRDLDRIIDRMRERLLRGGDPARLAPPRPPRGFALKRLRALQLRKLRRTVAYTREQLPFYTDRLGSAGVGEDDLRGLDDLRRLPVTFRADLQDRPDDFVSRAPGMQPVMPLRTSGTMGQPLELHLTQRELDAYVAAQAIGGMMGGFLGPREIFQIHMVQENSVGARIFTAAARRAGAEVLTPGLSGDLDADLESIFRVRNDPGRRAKVSGLFTAPGYLWALTARAEQCGLSGKDSGLRRIFTSGAMVSEALKQRVMRFWGLPLREGYSTVETPATGAYECGRGRLHFLDASGLIEVLDPETREPVPDGQPGVGVITAFYPDRELTPVLRYWTDDLMIRSKTRFCECGMVSTLLEDILGRADHMFTVGGYNFYPQAVGDALTAFREVIQPPRFQVMVEERSAAHHVLVDVEAASLPSAAAREAVERRILDVLPFAGNEYITSGSVRPEVRLVPAGSIREPFRYKLQGPAPRYPAESA